MERDADQSSEIVDVAVVGASYAGLSAALGLRRHRLSTVAFDGGPPRNAASAEVHGYLGCERLSAEELLQRARRQVLAVGGRIERLRVRAARREGGLFVLEDESGGRRSARRLVLATGVRDRLPDIPGVDEFYGRSLHVCPHCDAFEWRERPIAIVSWTGATRDFALKVSHWSRQVTVVTDGRRPRLDEAQLAELEEHGIAVKTAAVERLEGDDGRLRAVRFEDGSRLAVEAAFFSLGQEYNTELAEQLGCRLTSDGAIEVGAEQQTSIEGVWAVGDVAGDSQFVAVAVAHGVKAAVDVYRTLAPTDPQAREP